MPSPYNPQAQPASRTRASKPWLAVFLIATLLIWGNSLVPGEDSGALSMAVVRWLQEALGSLGLPHGWVTNFVVRKTAHFLEYLALGLVGMQAFGPHRPPARALAWLLTAAVLVAVPAIDETIQLFVSGRAGSPADVALDCCGALAGVLLTIAASRVRARRAAGKPPARQA